MKSVFITLLATIWALGSLAAQADVADNRVSVLASGYVQPIEGKSFLPGAQTDGARKVASTISLVQGKDLVLIADPGMAAPGVWDQVLMLLSSKGVTPEEVTHVFISHHHPDHVTQLGLFPNATLVDFWATYKNDVWADHPDNYELAPGVKVIRTPGHTGEDASLLVETSEGTYALTHLWWSPGFQPTEDPLAEDQHGIEHSRELVLKQADWIVPGHGATFKNPHRKQIKLTKNQSDTLINAVNKASTNWISSFNSGDAAGCANAYEADGIMTAKPFGTYAGREAIQAFWQNLISQGYSDVRYIDREITIISANAAVISSKWAMNKTHGIITKELWVLQENGTAKLRVDEFEVLGTN
jgi:glyoxylase-like metal-dependent hydrolase (beta-lactamase superfamily II)